MKIEHGDLWEKNTRGHWVCIPTNGVVSFTGKLVMGGGVALEARRRYLGVALYWGDLVKEVGNFPYIYEKGRLISFPTKHDYAFPSTLELIETSAMGLVGVRERIIKDKLVDNLDVTIYLPKVGCGLGGLDWDTQVCPLLQRLLDDNFVALI